jgi:hypothetical protein
MQSRMACGWVFGPTYGAGTVAALPSGNALRASNALRAKGVPPVSGTLPRTSVAPPLTYGGSRCSRVSADTLAACGA